MMIFYQLLHDFDVENGDEFQFYFMNGDETLWAIKSDGEIISIQINADDESMNVQSLNLISRVLFNDATLLVFHGELTRVQIQNGDDALVISIHWLFLIYVQLRCDLH